MTNDSNKIITSNFKCKVCEAGRERRINVHIIQGCWVVMGKAKDGSMGNQKENFTGK